LSLGGYSRSFLDRSGRGRGRGRGRKLKERRKGDRMREKAN